MITIYHNPRCSKSRQALELLQGKNLNIEIVLYLENPLSEREITDLLTILDVSPRDVLRKKEKEFKDLGLDNLDMDEKDIIKAIASTPKLLERPIVVSGDKAAIGRPLENILDII